MALGSHSRDFHALKDAVAGDAHKVQDRTSTFDATASEKFRDRLLKEHAAAPQDLHNIEHGSSIAEE